MTEEHYDLPAGKHSFPFSLDGILRRKLSSEGLIDGTGAVLLFGDAGTGKSTLVAQEMHKRENILVYRLDATDSDAELLLCGLQALVCPGTPLTAGTPEMRVQELIRALQSRGALLILDSAEVIETETAQLVLLPILRAAKGTYSVLLIARGIPGYTFQITLDDTCRKIGGAALYLKETELAQWIGTLMPGKPPEQRERYIKLLWNATMGWLAGIRLIMDCIRENRMQPGADSEGILLRSGLRQYTVTELLGRMPDRVSDFIKAASVFPVLTAAGLRDGIGYSDAAELLNCAADAGFPLIVNENGGIRMIPVLREILLRVLGNEERKRLSCMAAAYEIRQDNPEEAIGIACDAQNPELCCNLLTSFGSKLLIEGKSNILKRCAAIVEYIATSVSVLDVLAQYHYSVGECEKAERLFSRADSTFGKENRYSVCRSLYHALHRFEEEPAEYIKKISLALFTLHEMKAPLPYLTEKDRAILRKVEQLNENEFEVTAGKPLSVRMFGNFSVIARADGREIPWRTRKGCELFAYLVSLRGEATDRSSLFDILWHEEMPNNAVAMLHNMIYNIRKELSGYGLENIIRYSNRKYSVDFSMIDTDTDAVLDVCEALKRHDSDKLASYAPFLGTYWGKYLDNVDDLWADEQKEYYDRVYVQACVIAGRKLQNDGKASEALLLLKNASAVDPYSEEIVGQRLSLLAETGRLDKVKAVYGDFCSLLDRELGVKPGEALRNTYEILMKRN